MTGPGSAAAGAAPERTSPNALADYIGGHVIASGEGPAWRDVFARIFSHRRQEQPVLVPAVAEPLVVWVISGSAAVDERDLGGDWLSSAVEVGDFFLTHSPTPYEMRWEAHGPDPFQVLHLYLAPVLFERAAGEASGKASAVPRLRDVSGGRDEALSQLLDLLRRELLRHEQSPLLVQGLAQGIAVHLVRAYADPAGAQAPGNALPAFRLRRAIAFMEAHLHEAFDLARVAREAGMSPFHFSRLFKRATGISPSQQVIRLRVARAQRLLRETDMSVIAVAMAVGYSSPSHFAQAFRRETGLAPDRYRRT